MSGLKVERVSAGVVVLSIDRPPSNYFDIGLLGALADACRVAAEDGARALLLRSTGKTFCAGADFGAAGNVELNPEALYVEAVRLFRRDLPMVAQVQGAAVGGGAGLALAADLRVVSDRSRFAVNFVKIGIHHGFGLTETLPHAVGQQRATDLLLTGRRIDGAEACRIGLADRIVSADRLDDAALELAEELAAAAPLAVRAVRRTMADNLADRVAEAVVREAAEQRALFQTEDFREGVAAVAQRRPGDFRGR